VTNLYAPTRKEFLEAVTGIAMLPTIGNASTEQHERGGPRVLVVVAHPDDEYVFAATVYRITHELGGIADQVIITNGEAGYRYAALAESVYGVSLVSESEGRAHLPSIRKAEALRAGEILGVRQHHFLNQRDFGFTDVAADASTSNWDHRHILSTLSSLLDGDHYDFVFTLLPTSDTHAHHRAATLLVLEAVSRMSEAKRPTVLGADPGSKQDAARFSGFSVQTATDSDAPAIVFDRTTKFGYRDALNYQIVVNWVIAEHKSQGLFQTDYGRHDVERFWVFAVSGADARLKTARLGKQLTQPGVQMAVAQ
jgi:LmbE family N-acetylglucosaminyl deacetylase